MQRQRYRHVPPLSLRLTSRCLDVLTSDGAARLLHRDPRHRGPGWSVRTMEEKDEALVLFQLWLFLP